MERETFQESGKVSMKILADDWLCQEVKWLHCAAAEGYPSRSQDARVLKQARHHTPKAKQIVSAALPKNGWTSPIRQENVWPDS